MLRKLLFAPKQEHASKTACFIPKKSPTATVQRGILPASGTAEEGLAASTSGGEDLIGSQAPKRIWALPV